MIKKILTAAIVAASAMCAKPAAAETALAAGLVPVSDINLTRGTGVLMLSMELDLSELQMGKDRQLTLIPVVHNADSTESVELRPVCIAGHNLYYRHLRENDVQDRYDLYKQGDKRMLNYAAGAADAEWMDDSRISVYYRIGGCCDATVKEGTDCLAMIKRAARPEFKAVFDYVCPTGDTVKTRELKKQAFVDFPVNKIVIYPEYRNNTVELAKIIATIDSVRNDPDITIDAISIKGFASPEGPYDHNVWLAKNRTEALKEYVRNLYHFAPDFISTDYEPEDWAGLRRFVAGSGLEDREAILAVIDSDMAPDPKNSKIQHDFPSQYRFLLQTVYPALRHSDYKIDYTIRQFTSIEEILRVLAEAPQKLSLSEFYRAAQSMTPGSAEYNNVFETAVRMYPRDAAANLNAANAAMSRGDLEMASYYLSRIDDDADPQVTYARGVLAALEGRYDDAETLFAAAARLKVAPAVAALEEVRAIKAYDERTADVPGGTTFTIISKNN